MILPTFLALRGAIFVRYGTCCLAAMQRVALCLTFLVGSVTASQSFADEEFDRILRGLDQKIKENQREEEQLEREQENRERQREQLDEQSRQAREREAQQLSNGADPEQVARQREQRENREAQQLRQLEEQAQRQEKQRQENEDRQKKEDLRRIIREATK